MGKRLKYSFVVSLLLFFCLYGFSQEAGYQIKTIVIDAGHGGKDPGNLGTGRYKTTEKHIVLDVSKKLGDYIKEQFPNINVIYTRDKDEFVGLNERAKLANEKGADLFISIHCNAFKNPESHGTETWVMGMHKTEANLQIAIKENSAILLEDDYEAKYEGFDPNSVESYIALVMFQSAFINQSLDLASRVQRQFKTRVSRVDRGVKQAGFVVISKTTMPSILVELGFLTNKDEEDFLNSDKGKVYMASAIFRAFKEFKSDYEIASDATTQEVGEITQEANEEQEAKKTTTLENAKKDSIAKAIADEKAKELERKIAENAAKAKADSLAKEETERLAKLKADSIARAKEEILKMERAKQDSIAKDEAKKKAEAKADSMAKVQAWIEKSKRLKREQALRDSIALVKAANTIFEEQRKVSQEKEKKELQTIAEKEMVKQKSLWNEVSDAEVDALSDRTAFEKYMDASLKLDQFLWENSTEKDRTEDWKERRKDKKYQRIYYAFQLGQGRNVETFKSLIMLYPENAKYSDVRAFAMYEQYITDKMAAEINGDIYEGMNFKEIIKASDRAFKEELQRETDRKAELIADSLANVEKQNSERLKEKKDSLKRELSKFREDVKKEDAKQELVERDEFEKRKEELLSKIEPASETITGNKNITFRVQFISSAKRYDVNSSKFDGVKDVWEYKDGTMFKYTAGKTTSIDDAVIIQREMRQKGYKGAFVVAFLNGERIALSKARELLDK